MLRVPRVRDDIGGLVIAVLLYPICPTTSASLPAIPRPPPLRSAVPRRRSPHLFGDGAASYPTGWPPEARLDASRTTRRPPPAARSSLAPATPSPLPSPTTGLTAVISGFSSLPWLIKPIYGFISDSIPLFGYRRRSYLILSGFLGALSWSLMATVVDSKYGAALSILLGSLSVAFSDVVVDSMVVERARGESQSTSGSLQSLCWGSSAFGGIVSAYFSGSLVDTYGVRFVFGVTAFLPLMTSAVAVLVNEHRLTPGEYAMSVSGSGFIESSTQHIKQLWTSVKQPQIFLPTLFIFLWQATPHSESAMFFFITNKLGFTPEFLGRVKLVTSIASLLGVGIYNYFLKAVHLRKIFLVTTIIGSALGMTQVLLVTGLNRQFGISDEWFSIGDSLIITVLGQAAFMPVLVLAAKLCPPGMEATLFATLMSVSNAGSVTGGLVGAGLTKLLGVTRESFGNLPLLIIICNLSSLLPLPLLGLLPDEEDSDNEETKHS